MITVCPFNEREIVIMGSRESNAVFLFDTKRKQMKKVAEGGPVTEYMNIQNSVVKVMANKVIALTFNRQN